MKKQTLIPLAILFFLVAITTLVILYGKGYRIGGIQSGKPTITKTGLLVTTSVPDGAQVFIDGNLTTATNDTLDLLPGDYTVRIQKEGYLPWEKKVRIQKEVVTKTAALLFPAAPRLENITASGVENPVMDPSGRRIAFRVASQSAKTNGIYILDMTSTPILSLQSSAKQITDDVTALFSASDYQWSPNGEELMASVSGQLGLPDYFLLKTSGYNDTPRNVTAVLTSVTDQWSAQKTEREIARMNGLRPQLKQLVSNNFHVLAWSPDDDKILYSASRSATLPVIIKPRHIGIDTMREDREIEENDVYVYDINDDVNMKVFNAEDLLCEDEEKSCIKSLQWFPDSNHLVFIKDNKVTIMESDGTNTTTIFAGPFLKDFLSPWPNGSKVVILTNFNNPDVPANLYTIGLK